MQVRRARTEQLSLITSDGATVVLATANREVGTVDSQDELAVSPDGAYLAWTSPGDDRLHLRDAEGHERLLLRYARMMRFSPDGKRLAALTKVGRGDWYKLVVWELATGNVQPLYVSALLGRFEWVPGGLVVAQRDELVLVLLTGDQRSLFKAAKKEQLQRFSAAPAGDRVAMFVETNGKLKLRSL